MNTGTVYNCAFSINSAGRDGGGMDDCTAYNCTLSGNYANQDDGGMHNGTANNCILWYNTTLMGNNNINSTTTRYVCSPDVTNGVDGCITNEPQLASSSHLSANSPCIATGSSIYRIGKDIDEESWKFPPSIGCDEYNIATTGLITLAINASTKVSINVAVPINCEVTGAVSSNSLNFGDNTSASNLLYTSHSWSSTGIYDIVLTAYNNDYPAGISVTQQIEIADTPLHVTTTGNDANDGLSWATAKITIQAAVDIAYYGQTIKVMNGTYNLTSEITVTNSVHIQSVNDPQYTIIDGNGSNRCFNLGSSACIISGFTITNGFSPSYGGGIYCLNTKPVFSNCTFILNYSSSIGGGMYYGNADNSTFTSNSTTYDGGGIYNSLAYNSILWYNTALGVSNNFYHSDTLNVCSPDVTVGINGCITNTPLFIDRMNKDFHLQTNSLCINAGNNLNSFSTTDLDGNQRIINGIVDIGAYEFNPYYDTDGDGIPDSWELLYFGDTTNCVATDNSDSDTLNNLSEYIAGTNPTNGTSYFSITNVQAVTNGFIVDWDPSISNRKYSVFWTDELSTGFLPLTTNMNYPQNSYTDTVHTASEKVYYKVKVQL